MLEGGFQAAEHICGTQKKKKTQNLNCVDEKTEVYLVQ